MKTHTAQPKMIPKEQRLHGQGLQDLLVDELMELLDAERKLAEVLPDFGKACFNEELEDAFRKHHQVTLRHIDRLEKTFRHLNLEARALNCDAMTGLINEAKHILKNYREGHVRDSALIIAAQKIEHYEIASYGSVCEMSDVLGYWNLCDLLGKTLNEEEITDEELTDIATRINDKALQTNIQP